MGKIGVLFGSHRIKICCQPRLSTVWLFETKLGIRFPAFGCSIPQSSFSRGPSAPVKTFLLCLTWTLPARSCRFARCVIHFRSSCLSKRDVPLHGQYIGVETSVFLKWRLFTDPSHTDVCMKHPRFCGGRSRLPIIGRAGRFHKKNARG